MKEYQVQFSDGKDVEYFTWKSLKRANDRAIRMNLNRQIQKGFIDNLDKELRFPVQLSLLKEGASDMFNCIRYILIIDTDGNTVHLDVPIRFTKKDVFSMEVNI
jgi:hypothetical protein|tara:strand:+ start:154 stop:465 length:312 start_codon:yes stop_codon:yes gene_type:complete